MEGFYFSLIVILSLFLNYYDFSLYELDFKILKEVI